MAFEGPSGGDIRATLALSQAEARTGSRRTLNLPGGRRIVVPIRAGIRNGEEIRLRGQGEAGPNGVPPGDLILTVVIAPTEQLGSQPLYEPGLSNSQGGATEFMQSPAFPPPNSSPNYPYHSSAPTGPIAPGRPTVTPSPNNPFSYSAPTVSSSSSSPSFGSGGNYPGQTVPVQGPPPLFLAQKESSYADPAQYMVPQQPVQPVSSQYLPPPQRRPGISTGLIILIVLLVLLIIGGSAGLYYYTAIYQPQLHAQATATAQSQLTGTAQAQISSTAQANAQSTAQALATSQAQANATASAQASATAVAQATTTALQNLYTQVTSGTPTINDPLSSQDGNNWDDFPSNGSGGSCTFTGNMYHSGMSQKGFFQPCYGQATSESNFALEVQMTITQGDEGGILFRADNTNSQFYLFRISQKGAYDLYVYVDSQGSHAQQILTGSSSLIHTGTGQTNTITVIAQGSNLYFYINQQYLNSITNGTYTSGKIGVFAESDANPTDVAYSNLKVWNL